MDNKERLAEALTSDGATVDLENGDRLRLVFRPDDTNPFEDTDSYGRVEYASDRWYNERPVRPSGFDGNAEKLRSGRGYDAIWWQPPADVKRSDPWFPKLRETVLELLEYGYMGVVIERLSGTDAYLRPIVVEVASLWCVEPFPTAEYLRSIVTDLIDEVL